MTQKNYEQILNEHYKEDPSWLDGYRKIDREEQLKIENSQTIWGTICKLVYEFIAGIIAGF